MSTGYLGRWLPEEGAVHIPWTPKSDKFRTSPSENWRSAGKRSACKRKAKQWCLSAITAQPCQLLRNAFRWRSQKSIVLCFPLFRLGCQNWPKIHPTVCDQAVRPISTNFSLIVAPRGSRGWAAASRSRDIREPTSHSQHDTRCAWPLVT